MQRIHRESYWYVQYLPHTLPSTKYFLSVVIAATSSMPVMVLFQSLFGRFELISTILTAMATAIGIFIIQRINTQQGAPYIILSAIQTLLYTGIGTFRWGIQPAYIDFWGGLLGFILSITMVGCMVFLWLPNHSSTDAPEPLGIIDYVGITLLMIGATAFRWYNLNDLPAAANFEAIQSIYGQTAWANGTTNPIALNPDMVSQLMSVLYGMSMQIFGENVGGGRHLSVIIGTLAVIATFLATRMFFETRTAWLTAIVLMAMSSHIEFSRLVVPAILDTLLLSALLYSFASAWGSGKRRWYMVAGIILSLTQYSYHAGKIIPVVFAVWLCMYAIQYWQDVESRMPHLSSMWGVAMVGSLPHWWSVATQLDRYIETVSQSSLFGMSNESGMTWLQSIAQQQQIPDWLVLLYSIRNAAAGFIAVPLRDQYEIGLALLTIPAAVLFMLGLFIIARGYSDPRHWLLIIGLLSAVSITALTINAPTAQRMVYMTPFAAIVIGIGIAEMGRWFKIDWIQHDWQINPLIIMALSFGLAIAIAGYDGQSYLGATRNSRTNTTDQSASAISKFAKSYPAESTMYLFTQPDFYYHESALLQFQLPQVTGIDVYPPLQGAPPWQVSGGNMLFVFSNSRINELEYIRQFYPGGVEQRAYTADGQILLIFYEVAGINQLSAP